MGMFRVNREIQALLEFFMVGLTVLLSWATKSALSVWACEHLLYNVLSFWRPPYTLVLLTKVFYNVNFETLFRKFFDFLRFRL